ncbi:MAG TPA: TAXI family TRAP transporter solute-binding subunit [Firmicutes bacterium]|nr:TAXI family TRAP transporter solute-binding subunit [Bacillota bacterium]
MKRKTWIAALALVLVVSLIGGCTGKPAAQPEGQKPSTEQQSSGGDKQTFVTIAGATSGGTYFLLANAMAKILNDKLGSQGWKASAQSTPGTPTNIKLLGEKQIEFAFGQAGVAYEAYNGVGSYAGKPKAEYLRAVMYMYPNVLQMVATKKSGIKSLADVKGKTVCVGAAGSATELNSRDLFAQYGLDYVNRKDFKAEYTSESQSVELLKNGQADVANLVAAVPSAAMMDLTSAGEVILLPIGLDIADKLHNINPAYYADKVPAGAYPGLDKDVPVVSVANWIFTRADVPDEVVYNFVKAMYENHDDLVAAHKVAQNTTLENALDGQTIPLHPGAEKYFKEKGVLK